MVSCHYHCHMDGKGESLEEGVRRARVKSKLCRICALGLTLLISRMGRMIPGPPTCRAAWRVQEFVDGLDLGCTLQSHKEL